MFKGLIISGVVAFWQVPQGEWAAVAKVGSQVFYNLAWFETIGLPALVLGLWLREGTITTLLRAIWAFQPNHKVIRGDWERMIFRQIFLTGGSLGLFWGLAQYGRTEAIIINVAVPFPYSAIGILLGAILAITAALLFCAANPYGH